VDGSAITGVAMNIARKEITLNTSGMGIIFYSPQSARHITEGSDYFTPNYSTEQQVQSHIQKGSIVCFGTGSPGTFSLKFHSGYPEEKNLKACEFKLRLGLHCEGGLVCFRDLFDLLQWRSACPPGQAIALDDGFYHVTLCSDLPESGILGDKQTINVYLQKLDAFPNLAKHGVPTLCI
jgi:hypothetical protein